MTKIITPFTEEQCKKLNEFQKNGRFHPFTCCSPPEIKDCFRRNRPFDGSPESDGLLIATPQGWVCPCGKYTQDWAHDFMSEELPPDPFAHLRFQNNDSDGSSN